MFMTKAHKEACIKLEQMGIRTTADLDALKGDNSRYDCLVELVGKEGADWILNDLALKQCCKRIG